MVAEVPEPSKAEQEAALYKVIGAMTRSDQERFGLSADEQFALTCWYSDQRRVYRESKQ